MHLNDDISRIIMALDKSQKKHFIQYSKIYTSSKNNLYLSLYKLIEKNPSLSKDEQQTKLKLTSNQQLRDIRRNLKEALLKCLRNYHENSWHINETLDLYKNAKILHYLDLNDIAEKEVEKAIHKQTQYDQILIKHLYIYDSALNVWNQDNTPKSTVSKLALYMKEEENAFNEYVAYRAYYKILLELEYLKALIISEYETKKIETRIDQLIKITNKKSVINHTSAQINLAKNYILSILYAMKGNVEMQIDSQKTYIQILDKLKPTNQDLDDAYKKISMCYLFAQAYSSLSRLDLLEKYSSLLLEIFRKKDIENNSWLWRKTLNFYVITQTQYLIKAESSLAQIHDFIGIFSKYKLKIEKKDLIQYHTDDISLLCLLCFHYELYDEYFIYSKLLLSSSNQEILKDSYFIYLLLETMWNISKENWEISFSLLKKMQRILPIKPIESIIYHDLYHHLLFIYKNHHLHTKLKSNINSVLLKKHDGIVWLVFKKWILKLNKNNKGSL